MEDSPFKLIVTSELSYNLQFCKYYTLQFLQLYVSKRIIYFFRKRDTTCHSGDGVFDTICEVSLCIYAIITSNMFEAILLYFCMKAIEKQNDAAQELIGRDQYRKRRRYSKIVFNVGFF